MIMLAAMNAWFAPRALALPWADVSSRQLRQDVDLLKAAGLLSGPVISWPLSWEQLTALRRSESGPLPAYVAHAVTRVLARGEAAGDGLHAALNASATNAPALVRDFGDTAREAADVAGAVSIAGKGGFARLGASMRSFQPGSDLQLDGSLLGYALYDWHAYAGYTEQWWGPSNEGTLLISHSARTFPKVGFKRMGTSPFESKWLSWMGPWRAEAFVGVLDEEREASNALVVGMRVELEPLRGWEIGLSRMLQLCGRGRPCGGGVWGRALIGVGDLDNTGTQAEPGNQLAAIDTKFSLMVRELALSLYAQGMAEDEGSFTIYRFSQLWGATLSGALGSRGAMWTFGLEYADTRARDYLFAGAITPGVAYGHFLYTDGLSYRGRPIAFSLDGDTRLASATLSITDAEHRRFYGAGRFTELNAYGTPAYHISDNRETIWVGESGMELPIPRGLLRFELRLMVDAPDTPRSSPIAGQIEAGYRLGF